MRKALTYCKFLKSYWSFEKTVSRGVNSTAVTTESCIWQMQCCEMFPAMWFASVWWRHGGWKCACGTLCLRVKEEQLELIVLIWVHKLIYDISFPLKSYITLYVCSYWDNICLVIIYVIVPHLVIIKISHFEINNAPLGPVISKWIYIFRLINHHYHHLFSIITNFGIIIDVMQW